MTAPLADRMRPQRLEEVVGQHRWLGPNGPLRKALETNHFGSMVLWGPPGCGKTTLARVLAHRSGLAFEQLSAVLSGVKDLRAIVERARQPSLTTAKTLLFIDEIHRWNKAQQDALLPHIEDGTLVLVGATTENPSFALNPALRSRLLLVRLEPLSTEDVRHLLCRALQEPQGVPSPPPVDEEVLEAIARAAAGDARRALTDLERATQSVPQGERLDMERLQQALHRSGLRHDRDGEDHYNVVSAWIKSMRGSAPDASVYWLARLMAAGEDPRFLARRLIVFAAEDVGNADPRALGIATATAEAVDRVGMPEARIPLGQACLFMACAPKSNAAYVAINQALAEVERSGAQPVPLHLRQASDATSRAEGYGQAYRYPHDHPYGVVRQDYLPPSLQGVSWYEPKPWGDEKLIGERLAFWNRKLSES